ncbi:MAG TPA: hypothetical protein VGI79_05700 [Caulobacteraceae bacterium]|jgi:hypothetical protein
MRRPSAAVALLALLAGLSTASPSHALALPKFAPPSTLFDLAPRKPEPSLVFTYDGFQVDGSAAPRGQSADKTVRQIKAQIDLVEHMGLKPETLAFMRTVPILADPAKPNAQGEAVHYVRGRGVVIRVNKLSPKKPILLGGLLRAYYDQRLASGPANSDIARFRTEAAARHVWPKTALMLQSDGDYFALTGSAYLHGAITHEPYTRVNLRQTQPRYYRWLAQLFDDGRARG